MINVGCQGYMGGSFIKRPLPATSQKSIYQHLMKSVHTKCLFAGRELRESWFIAMRYNSEVREAQARESALAKKKKAFLTQKIVFSFEHGFSFQWLSFSAFTQSSQCLSFRIGKTFSAISWSTQSLIPARVYNGGISAIQKAS